MDKAGPETGTIRQPSAMGSRTRLKLDGSDEPSVDKTVKTISLLSILPGKNSDLKLLRMLHRISTTLSCVASQMILSMSAKTDTLKNGSLLSLHLAEVSARFHAELEASKRSEMWRLTPITSCSTVKSCLNNAYNGTSKAARLPGGTIYLSKSFLTDGPTEREDWVVSHDFLMPLLVCFESISTEISKDNLDSSDDDWLGELTQAQRTDWTKNQNSRTLFLS